MPMPSLLDRWRTCTWLSSRASRSAVSPVPSGLLASATSTWHSGTAARTRVTAGSIVFASLYVGLITSAGPRSANGESGLPPVVWSFEGWWLTPGLPLLAEDGHVCGVVGRGVAVSFRSRGARPPSVQRPPQRCHAEGQNTDDSQEPLRCRTQAGGNRLGITRRDLLDEQIRREYLRLLDHLAVRRDDRTDAARRGDQHAAPVFYR